MTDLYFVDTNLLVYARDSSEREKQPVAANWLRSLWESRTGRLSTQVLQEYYQVVTRRLSPGLEPQAAREDVRDLWQWQPILIDEPVVEDAWKIEESFGLSWWDSLIVGAARTAGCQYLLTEDLQHGQSLDGLTVLNPFHTDVTPP